MNFKLTKRDRRLLQILGVVVVVALFSFLILYPLAENNADTLDKITTEKERKVENERKVKQLTNEQAIRDDQLNSLQAQQKEFYSVMESDEIDRLLTDMAVKGKLEARNMTITIPDTWSTLTPYSVKAGEVSKEEDTPEDESMPTAIGVKMAVVNMQVRGDSKNLMAFLDTLTNDHSAIRVASYQWSSNKEEYVVDNDGVSVLQSSKSKLLNMDLEIYMCEKEE